MAQQALNQPGGLPVERVVLISIVSLEERHFTCGMSQSLPSLKYQVIVEAESPKELGTCPSIPLQASVLSEGS